MPNMKGIGKPFFPEWLTMSFIVCCIAMFIAVTLLAAGMFRIIFSLVTLLHLITRFCLRPKQTLGEYQKEKTKLRW